MAFRVRGRIVMLTAPVAAAKPAPTTTVRTLIIHATPPPLSATTVAAAIETIPAKIPASTATSTVPLVKLGGDNQKTVFSGPDSRCGIV